MLVTRLAGIKAAIAATVISTIDTDKNVAGSVGVIANNRFDIILVTASAPATLRCGRS